MAFSVAKAFIYALLQPLMRSYAQMINRNDIFKNVADVRKAVSAKVFEAMSCILANKLVIMIIK